MSREVFKVSVRKETGDGCEHLRRIALYSRTRYLMPFVLLLVTIGDSANAQEKPSSTLLRIGVSHSEVLPELPLNQQVGQVFDGFDVQPAQNQKSPPVIPQAKQSVQQSVKPNPMLQIPGAWPSNFKGVAATPLKSTAKPMPPKIPPGYPKPPAQTRPTKAEIAAAIQAYASQRNPRAITDARRGWNIR
jgi:hypothetical protein